MRKVIPALCALTVAAAPLAAQASVGVLGGFVSSNVSVSGTNGTLSSTSRSGFAAGISIDGRLAHDVYLGPEALYVEKGFEEHVGGETGTFGLNYIEVPVLLKLAVGDRPTKFFVLGGPDIAFKVSCSQSLSGDVESNVGCSNSTNNNIRTADVGLMFGAGVMVDALSIQARYDLGLTNVYNNDNGYSYKNHALLILAGLRVGR